MTGGQGFILGYVLGLCTVLCWVIGHGFHEALQVKKRKPEWIGKDEELAKERLGA